jgi:hypothetical protein
MQFDGSSDAVATQKDPPGPKRGEGRVTIPANAQQLGDTTSFVHRSASFRQAGDMSRQQRRDWRRHVFGCHELTFAQRLVLLALESFADYPAGTNAHPGTAVLAERCGCGMRVVELALADARRLGLIQQTARANPKRHLAAVYRLLAVPISLCTSVRVEDSLNPHRSADRTTFQPAREDISIRTSLRPTKPLTPKEGGLPKSGTSPDGPTAEANAPLRCPKHPDGTDEPCGKCKEVRLHSERQREAEQEEKRRLGRARRAAIEACDLCDQEGYLLDTNLDSNTVEPCQHPNINVQPASV